MCVYPHNPNSSADFSAYVRGYSKSRHCAYIRTFLIVTRIFCAYVRGNSKSRHCAYIRTFLSSADFLCVRTRKLQISSLCVYPHNPNSRADSFCVRTRKLQISTMCIYAHNPNSSAKVFFCVRTRKLQISSLFVYAHNLNSSAGFLRTYVESKSSNCAPVYAHNRNNRVLLDFFCVGKCKYNATSDWNSKSRHVAYVVNVWICEYSKWKHGLFLRTYAETPKPKICVYAWSFSVRSRTENLRNMRICAQS